jgi:hypothetical protein
MKLTLIVTIFYAIISVLIGVAGFYIAKSVKIESVFRSFFFKRF